MFTSRLSWLVIVGCIGIGCAAYPKAGTVPGPVSPALVQQAQTRWPEATEQSLVQGRDLFVERCQRCHKLPDRRAISDERWPKILEVMAPRAKLDANQHRLVLEFILAERNQPAVAFATGRVMKNVAPDPSTLSAHILPP